MLKTCGALGAGTVATAAGASPVSAYWTPDTFVSFTAVEGTAEDYVEDASTFVDDLWNSDVDNSSGEYSLYTNVSSFTIPESALSGNDTLEERRQAADDYLQSEYGSYYDDFDAHVVIDDFADDPADPWAIGPHAVAGNASKKTGIANAWYEANNDLPKELQMVGTAGLSARPVMQMYGAEHSRDVKLRIGTKTFNRFSVMWNDDGADCETDEVYDGYVYDYCSPCTIGRVRNYMDQNVLAD